MQSQEIIDETSDQDVVAPPISESQIRDLAYLKWLSETGGQTLPEDPQGVRFWIEAEKELRSN